MPRSKIIVDLKKAIVDNVSQDSQINANEEELILVNQRLDTLSVQVSETLSESPLFLADTPYTANTRVLLPINAQTGPEGQIEITVNNGVKFLEDVEILKVNITFPFDSQQTREGELYFNVFDNLGSSVGALNRRLQSYTLAQGETTLTLETSYVNAELKTILGGVGDVTGYEMRFGFFSEQATGTFISINSSASFTSRLGTPIGEDGGAEAVENKIKNEELFDYNLATEEVLDRKYPSAGELKRIALDPLAQKEVLSNKAINFDTIDNSKYPTTQAVEDRLSSLSGGPTVIYDKDDPGNDLIYPNGIAFIVNEGFSVTRSGMPDLTQYIGKILKVTYSYEAFANNNPVYQWRINSADSGEFTCQVIVNQAQASVLKLIYSMLPGVGGGNPTGWSFRTGDLHEITRGVLTNITIGPEIKVIKMEVLD